MKKFFFRAFLITIGVLVLLVAGLYFGLVKPMFDSMNPEEDDAITEALEQPVGGKFNILLLGTDASDRRTDTMMMLCVDKDNAKINIISLYRDTRVKIKGEWHKLNACTVYGDTQLLIDTVKDMTGAPIHYYVETSFTGFRNIIDALGGVDIDVKRDMDYEDPYQDLYIHIEKGPQHMDGKTAEGYVRFRRYPLGDVDRAKVQQEFITELIKQKLNLGTVFRLPEIMKVIGENVKTNFTAEDFLANISAIGTLAGGEVEVFHLPGEQKTINKASYYIHDPEATYKMFKDNFLGAGAPD